MSDAERDQLLERVRVLRTELAITESERLNYREQYELAVAKVKRIRALHHPVDDDGRPRCNACVAGYDPKSRGLVFAAYPCSTISTLGEGER